ncbi:unnamed protein product [Anisakis simplex]|uniref:Uncharacterized protein n=1 Tax=Anisakis simplex TaxID=6269 RepID=A0A0M3JQF5_ANISI|nr:unnamed protein product [Anisakis simplex]
MLHHPFLVPFRLHARHYRTLIEVVNLRQSHLYHQQLLNVTSHQQTH